MAYRRHRAHAYGAMQLHRHQRRWRSVRLARTLTAA